MRVSASSPLARLVPSSVAVVALNAVFALVGKVARDVVLTFADTTIRRLADEVGVTTARPIRGNHLAVFLNASTSRC